MTASHRSLACHNASCHCCPGTNPTSALMSTKISVANSGRTSDNQATNAAAWRLSQLEWLTKIRDTLCSPADSTSPLIREQLSLPPREAKLRGFSKHGGYSKCECATPCFIRRSRNKLLEN
jgi:hypothetical protein